MSQSLSYCGQQVRAQDPDRFFLSLFAPADRRTALWALFALNAEIAKTREVVSETQLGLMRLQWWREAIGKIYAGEVSAHAVLKDLAPAIEKYELPRAYFETLIYAREFDLESVLPANMEGVLNYADFTSTPLLKLALMIAGGDPEYEASQPVAVNYALAGILRAVPFHARQRRCLLPEDRLKQHGVTQRQLFDFLNPEEGMRFVVREVAGQFVENIRPQNRMLHATQSLAGLYMRQIRKHDYNVFSPALAVPPPFKELRVFLGSL